MCVRRVPIGHKSRIIVIYIRINHFQALAIANCADKTPKMQHDEECTLFKKKSVWRMMMIIIVIICYFHMRNTLLQYINNIEKSVALIWKYTIPILLCRFSFRCNILWPTVSVFPRLEKIKRLMNTWIFFQFKN